MPSPTERTDNGLAFRHQVTDTSSRFPIWISLFTFSCVTMFSLIFHPNHIWDAAWGWVIGVAIMSSICSFVGFMAYMKVRGLFMGQMPELCLASFVLFIWIPGMWVIMNPRYSIAAGVSKIVDANTYFASWGSFVCSIFLFGQVVREMYGLDLAGRLSPIARTRAGKWYMMFCSSGIVLLASVRAYIAEGCAAKDMNMAPKCNQTKLAIASGVVGTLLAAVISCVVIKSGPIKLFHEWNAALSMVIIYAFGIAFITAGEGPGASIGNLYFFTWISFILSILIFTSCHMESLANREQANAAAATADINEADDDIELQEQPSQPLPRGEGSGDESL